MEGAAFGTGGAGTKYRKNKRHFSPSPRLLNSCSLPFAELSPENLGSAAAIARPFPYL
jgi:hypothetical protein